MEILKKVDEVGGRLEITVDTDYLGNDDVMYTATATLAIEADGTFYIDTYDYFADERWNQTEERDWEKRSIEQTFEIKL